MKKLLSVLVVLSVVLSTCLIGAVTVANALEESPEADFMFFDGVIEEYVGPGGVVVIPQAIDGVMVEEIAARAFYANTDITEVHIPEGVAIIGESCFRNCSNLEKVTLPYSLTALPASCFAACAITEIVIPGNVEWIGNWCFSSNQLKKITISYGVERILEQAFCSNPGSDVVFPETVEIIASAVFYPQTDGTRVTYTICNPDCEVGLSAGNNAGKSEKGEWIDGVFWSPFSSPHAAVNYKIIVPENSSVEKFLTENEKAMFAHPTENGYHNDSFTITPKSADYFDNLKENQKDWGITKPTGEEWSATDTPNTPQQGENQPSTENQTQNGGASVSDTNKNSANTNPSAASGNSGIVLAIIIAAVVIVLIIAGVVVFAIIYLGKPKKKKAPTEEEIVAKVMAQMKAEEVKSDEE